MRGIEIKVTRLLGEEEGGFEDERLRAADC
jgi:hypothetical protein